MAKPQKSQKPQKQKSKVVIDLKSITKRYGYGDAASYALDNFDLTVKRGEFIMVMGPSGCGKTTLLNIIGLLDKPSSGSYFLNQQAVSRLRPSKKARIRSRKIGIIFQDFNLIPTLNVLENVTLPLSYASIHKTARENQADQILERFHLKNREYYMPYQLSGGQQQRVAIARSLVARPEIILADEPTGNLDSRSAHIIMEELRNIHQEGNTIIMVTHNPNLTAYATRVIHMLDGRIDTDIKTVADRDLPQPVSVHIGRRILDNGKDNGKKLPKNEKPAEKNTEEIVIEDMEDDKSEEVKSAENPPAAPDEATEKTSDKTPDKKKGEP